MICYRLFLSDEPEIDEIEKVVTSFPNITFELAGGVVLERSPYNYLLPVNDSQVRLP